MQEKPFKIVIVDAGPVGLITALNLAKEGIDVTTALDVENSPRAMGYGPLSVAELERAGVAEEARAVGMHESFHEAELRWIGIDSTVEECFLKSASRRRLRTCV